MNSEQSPSDHRPYDFGDVPDDIGHAEPADPLTADPLAVDPLAAAPMIYTRRKLSPAQSREMKANSRLLKNRRKGARPEPNRVRPRLAVYERISEGDDDSSSMYRQRMENMERAAAMGAVVDWVRDVYFDYGVSAAGGHLRQGFEELMNAIAAGQYDGVLSWEVPRLVRDEDDAEIFRLLMIESSCELYVGCMKELSLWGPTAPMFPMMVKIAAGEVQAQSRRTASWHKRTSVHGLARCQAPFGMKSVQSTRRIEGRVSPIKVFAPDWEPREELGGRSRAELVRDAAAAAMAGESSRSIAHRWNAAGFRAGRGGLWTATAITRVLRTPKITGIAHRGSTLLDVNDCEVPKGRELDAQLKVVGEPLIAFADWFEMLRTLAGRRAVSDRRTQSETMLRGLVRCGRCTFRAESAGLSLRCGRFHQWTGGCGGNTINRAALEQFVVGVALGLVKNPDLRLSAAAANEPRRADRIAALEAESARLLQRLGRLAEAYVDFEDAPKLVRSQFLGKRAEVQRDLARNESALATMHQQSRHRLTVALSEAADVDAEWAAMPTHRQNSILHELIEKVWVDPVSKWTREPDLSRVRIVFATD